MASVVCPPFDTWLGSCFHVFPNFQEYAYHNMYIIISFWTSVHFPYQQKETCKAASQLQYHRGVRLPTCFGLLSSCCVQFSLLISSGCQQWPIIFMQHDLRLHIICWPYTSLHRIAYKVLSSPSQRRRAQNKSAKQPETVWLKRTDCPICPILHLGSFALQSGAVASELRDPWDCRRHTF